MKIYSQAGEKVICAHLDWGWPDNTEHAHKHLVEGAIYTLASITRNSFYTTVELEELPGLSFNSIHFENLERKE